MQKRLIPLLLLVSIMLSCASIREPMAPIHSQQEEESALRLALVEASQQVDPSLFSYLSLETYLGDGGKAMALHLEIPLAKERLESWKSGMASVFMQIAEKSKQYIPSVAETLLIANPNELMGSDESMTNLFEAQKGVEWEKMVEEEMIPLLYEYKIALSEVANDYEIWARGKKATANLSYPAITLPSTQEYCKLFYDTFLEKLREEEIDVRTTPRPIGSGSLYEFFQGSNYQ